VSRAGAATPDQAHDLALSRGTPLLVLTRISVSASTNLPVEVTLTYLNGHRFETTGQPIDRDTTAHWPTTPATTENRPTTP
jgi:GntR family transcriptional regulator